jgi:NTP pyrophosphatase (non-canonical NTP hydrolase)
MEECGELIQAISKLERYLENMQDDPNPDDPATLEGLNEKKQAVIDEIGDMWISLMALQCYYEDGTWGDKIDKRIEEKLNRKY